MPIPSFSNVNTSNSPASIAHLQRRSGLQFSPIQMLRKIAPTISSGMMRLPQEDDSSDDDQRSNQQNKSRRVHAAYLSEMKNAHSEGRPAHHIIQTSEQGVILGLRTKWHGAVKSLARREIDYKLKNYNDHPLAWSIVVGKIQSELNKMFIFEHTEVAEGYLEKYLKDSLTKDRHTWRKHWVVRRERHKKCPLTYFNAFHEYWDSEEGQQESKAMTRKRSLHANMGKDAQASNTISGGRSTSQNTSQVDALLIFSYNEIDLIPKMKFNALYGSQLQILLVNCIALPDGIVRLCLWLSILTMAEYFFSCQGGRVPPRFRWFCNQSKRPSCR
jgi:hypothetical protein